MQRAELGQEAVRDLRATVRWIAGDNPTAAREFKRIVFEAAEQIAAYPGIGLLRPEMAPDYIRFLVLGRFQHILVYDSRPRPPVIIRILHGARDLPPLFRQ